MALRWVPSHLPIQAVWGGHISPEDWAGNKGADEKADEAMKKLHPDPKDRAKLVEHIDSATKGILLLVAAVYGQVQAERQEAGLVPQGRKRRPWHRDRPEDPPRGSPGPGRARHRARPKKEPARAAPHHYG